MIAKKSNEAKWEVDRKAWEYLHRKLGCNTCTFHDPKKLFKGSCCTNTTGAFISDYTCHTREEKHGDQ